MRSAAFAILLGSTVFAPVALAQTPTPGSSATQSEAGPADLCQELLAYAEKKAAEPPKDEAKTASGAAPPSRADGQGTGTQGGGSVDSTSSSDTSAEGAAPAAAPVAPGSAPEPTTSGHASDGSKRGSGASAAGAAGPTAEFKLAGGISVQQVRETTEGGDRQVCRDMAQTMRRAGGDLPAGLLALAAYEPDPAKRQ